MSSPIWTRCEGPSSLRRIRVLAWRVVESQHIVSTRKLVDSDEEQGVLEDLIEQSKPPLRPAEAELHYLLFTPFRYPPLRYGSRFGRRSERGIFYASLTDRTAFSEVAYYRWLFLQGTHADLAPLYVDLTLFSAEIDAARGVDLTEPPFTAFQAQLADKGSYGWSQPLGTAMREAGVEAFVFRSARDPKGGRNLGVFEPSAFARSAPTSSQAWLCVVSDAAVELQRRDPLQPRQTYRFERSDFEVDGELPYPGG
ncbi:MAG: RES domain-containing protein [Deltaproteobacteria bacterium]|nr:MAG: RES domain-containing protein [Deltaproteobacteria bacterium]